MAKRAELSTDILLVLISHLEAPELAQFSATCKLLHVPALKRLLSSDIRLNAPKHLLNFCVCVLADPHTRGLWVRSLWLSTSSFLWGKDEDDEDEDEDDDEEEEQQQQQQQTNSKFGRIADTFTLSMLVAVIKACRNLRILSIPHLRGLVKADSNISSAIASLPHLVDLDLKDLDSQSVKTVKALARDMQSRPSILRVHFNLHYQRPAFPFAHPASFESLASVEVLHLHNANFPYQNASTGRPSHVGRASVRWS